jgi:glycosyltransferase involved in cell wall biosynthesis
MKWDILCLTMPTRTEFLARLRKNIEPQIERRNYANPEDVRLVIKLHDPNLSLGTNRQKMREESDAEYVSFCDDDDLVADNYVDRICILLDGVDYIGFRLQAYEDGVPLPGPTYHSLLCGGWFDKTYADGTKSWHRDISHLNPIKRDLALKVRMYGGYAEDSRWANDMRGLVKTEHYIEEVMYHYLSRTNKTDGVKVGPVSAGECPSCHSTMTVLINNQLNCNRCGHATP